jgi:hypothetical protein
MKELNLIGQKYNMLTVISLHHKTKKNMNYWVCQCECKNKTIVSTHNLRMGTVKSCGCLSTRSHRRDNLIGKKFDLLTVIDGYYDKEKLQMIWVCKCDCGNDKTIETIGSTLKNGRRTSCGCKRRLPYGENAFNRLYDTYRRRSLQKGFFFNLSKEEFKEITSQNCFYCGIKPKQIACKGYKKYYGEYIYNGIDRIDSSKGYEKDNIIPCCGQCNVAKNNHSYNNFLEWVGRIYNNFYVNQYEELENLKL